MHQRDEKCTQKFGQETKREKLLGGPLHS